MNTTTPSSPSLHVVLGTGPAGTTLVNDLADHGHRVRSVDRRGAGPDRDDVEKIQADLADPRSAIEATDGADVIYHCVNVAYHLQVELLPQITTSILAAAEANGAKLVVLDTLYPYGEAHGDWITEATPWAATSRKGRLRAGLDHRYLRAHEDGAVTVALGRSADFFGPGVFNSTLGGAFFPAVLTGQPVLALGNIDLPHSYSYLPDIARGLATLGTTEAGDGRIWHLPTVPAVSTATVHGIVADLVGHPMTVDLLTEPSPHGPFDEQFMAEYAEMFYQHLIPQHMVSTTFEREFGVEPTPLREALGTTTAWYRNLLQAS